MELELEREKINKLSIDTSGESQQSYDQPHVDFFPIQFRQVRLFSSRFVDLFLEERLKVLCARRDSLTDNQTAEPQPPPESTITHSLEADRSTFGTVPRGACQAARWAT